METNNLKNDELVIEFEQELDKMLNDSGRSFYGRLGRMMYKDLGMMIYEGELLSFSSVKKIILAVETSVNTRFQVVMQKLKEIRIEALKL